MAFVYIDRDGREFAVRVVTYARDRSYRFATHAEANTFALAKMGRGVVTDTTFMTPAQLSAHLAREARSAELFGRAGDGRPLGPTPV